MRQTKKDLSVIVQLSEGLGIAVKSDMANLSDYQEEKLKGFLRSVLAEQEPQNKIRVLYNNPKVIGKIYDGHCIIDYSSVL
ncbi:MAG: hypothetical protein P9L98_01655 [Candidatus Kaelpia imicola]|nr:hypothetical protein [Candidatus Kaelpia imicola]